MEEMEKRSDRHIRDLVAHTAFKGLDANEIGCARISVMAGSNCSFKGPNTDEQDQLSPDRHIRLATHGRSYNVPIPDLPNPTAHCAKRTIAIPPAIAVIA